MKQSNYFPTIGLEIHVQLKTKSKMFCDCANNSWKIGVEELKPNTAICPVCTGQPGTLPVINKQAVKMVVKAGLALNCRIADKSKFDRKNYFYPDLPKGYQISQYDEPICGQGCLTISNDSQKIRITRIHLEEDTAKNLHPVDGDCSLIDFNRSGIPLMELVTEPDIHLAQAAKQFCRELQQIFRALDISDADMEKSQMRCEVNISLNRQPPAASRQPLGTKVEIKNLNSFKAVERAIEYEIIRQSKLLDQGRQVIHETRGWDEKRQQTVSQRTKEQAHDYRYFPEPDLPPIYFKRRKRGQGLDKVYMDVDKIKSELPELPQAKLIRFKEQYGFGPNDANILITNGKLADFAENAMSELRAWLISLDQIGLSDDEAWEKYKQKLSKLTANWLINKLGGLLSRQSLTIDQAKVTPENFAEFIILIYNNKINSNTAQDLLAKMLDTGGDPTDILEDEGMYLLEDVGDLEPIIDQVIKNNPAQVKQYQAGKLPLLKFLIGQVMKVSQGKANPKMAEELLIQKLS